MTTKPMTLDRRYFFVAASAFALAGCADIVGPPPSPKLFMLTPKLPGRLDGPPVNLGLSVQIPAGTGGLDSQRIAIMRPPAGLDFYADTAWSDRLPELVQTDLVQAFEASGRISSVAREADGIRTDLFLNSDLRSFEARYDNGEGAPLAVVRLGVRLLDAKSRRLLASAVFGKEVRATTNSVDAAVAALTEAFSGVLAELVPWVLQVNVRG